MSGDYAATDHRVNNETRAALAESQAEVERLRTAVRVIEECAAVEQAELVAEVERLRDALGEQHMAHDVLMANHSLTVDERDAARAKVAAVRALIDGNRTFFPAQVERLLRALDGESVD